MVFLIATIVLLPVIGSRRRRFVSTRNIWLFVVAIVVTFVIIVTVVAIRVIRGDLLEVYFVVDDVEVDYIERVIFSSISAKILCDLPYSEEHAIVVTFVIIVTVVAITFVSRRFNWFFGFVTFAIIVTYKDNR